ncbi:hypothetical protein YC2023_043858 [Brassica napus]
MAINFNISQGRVRCKAISKETPNLIIVVGSNWRKLSFRALIYLPNHLQKLSFFWFRNHLHQLRTIRCKRNLKLT